MAAGVIVPLTTPDMIADFKACGGFLLLATDFRMMKVKEFPCRYGSGNDTGDVGKLFLGKLAGSIVLSKNDNRRRK